MQLGKDISVTQKTAWFMLQRIREAFSDENDLHCDDEGNDGKLKENVEIDESFIGGKTRTVTGTKKLNTAKVVVSRIKFLFSVCWKEETEL